MPREAVAKDAPLPPIVAAQLAAASGAVAAVLLQPLDVIRTQLQLNPNKTIAQHAKLIQPKNMWAGANAALLRVGGGAAVHFSTLQKLKQKVNQSQQHESKSTATRVATDAALGGMSRALAVTALCPITLVKTRMEAAAVGNQQGMHSVWRAVAQIFRDEGPLALWRGLLPSLAANVPFSAVHYASYQATQSAFRESLGEGMRANVTAGAVAALFATAVTQPFDVMRTRTMLKLTDSRCAVPASRSLFSGFGPRLIKRPAQTTILWSLYEELARLWRTVGEGECILEQS